MQSRKKTRKRSRPGNAPIRVLMSDKRCIPAVLRFLGKTGCGKLKEGVALTGQAP